jgi:hypothetical protein
LLYSRINSGWVLIFLATGVGTSVTGFGFLPIARVIDSHYVAIISLIILALAILGLYAFRLAGAWRWIFALGVVAAFYFDVLVAIAQAFKKVPALRALAPTASTEPAFVVAQTIALVIFIWIGVKAYRQFRPARIG